MHRFACNRKIWVYTNFDWHTYRKVQITIDDIRQIGDLGRETQFNFWFEAVFVLEGSFSGACMCVYSYRYHHICMNTDYTHLYIASFPVPICVYTYIDVNTYTYVQIIHICTVQLFRCQSFCTMGWLRLVGSLKW